MYHTTIIQRLCYVQLKTNNNKTHSTPNTKRASISISILKRAMILFLMHSLFFISSLIHKKECDVLFKGRVVKLP